MKFDYLNNDHIFLMTNSSWILSFKNFMVLTKEQKDQTKRKM